MATSSPRPVAPTWGTGELVSGLDAYFLIPERGSMVSREVRGGLVTFSTMAYIIALTRRCGSSPALSSSTSPPEC